MKYREVLQEFWDNLHREVSERKNYSIRNRDYSPINVKKEEYWGRDVPADWEHFGVCAITKGGFFQKLRFNADATDFDSCFKFEDLGIVAYDDLENPVPLNIRLIESEKWEMIEIKEQNENQ